MVLPRDSHDILNGGLKTLKTGDHTTKGATKIIHYKIINFSSVTSYDFDSSYISLIFSKFHKFVNRDKR